MIPYWPAPVLRIGGWHVSAFNPLLALAVAIWSTVAIRRARNRGLDLEIFWRMCFWLVVSTLIGAHLAKVMMEYWPQFVADPSLVFRQPGLRSVGGVGGGLIGIAVYARFRKRSFAQAFQMLDVITFALPFGWIFGRLGCFLVHDHRGEFTTSWIGILFPEGPRFDLGLIELLFLIPLSGLFLVLDRKPRPTGFFFALFGIVYGGFRIWLDTLALEPFRYFGWILVCLVGSIGWMLTRKLQRRESGAVVSFPARADGNA